jgi:hypothetical protein
MPLFAVLFGLDSTLEKRQKSGGVVAPFLCRPLPFHT